MIGLKNYTKKCKITQGAIKKFYLLPFVDYSAFQVQSDGMILTKYPASNIYFFDCLGNYSQDSQVEDGAYFLGQSVNIQLPKVYNELDIHLFLKQDYQVIVETNNGDNIMFGVYNGMEGTITNGSGSSKPEFNGFSLDFSGKEETTGLLIEDLSEFFTIKTANLLNALLNFNI